MAQRKIVTYVSDLSGAEITDNDTPTVTFALDGQEFAIDLSDKEQEKFRKIFEPYVAVATKGKKERGGKKVAASGPAAADIRAWANANNIEIPERGRIPSEVRDAYNAAH